MRVSDSGLNSLIISFVFFLGVMSAVASTNFSDLRRWVLEICDYFFVIVGLGLMLLLMGIKFKRRGIFLR